MARRTRCRIAGVVLLFALTPSAALAADSPTVTVRVEGDSDTLLARTSVAASGPALVRDGNSCPGNSAVAALERATAGAWSGMWNAAFSDWELTSIENESHSFSAAAYWGFFLNSTVANLGICGQTLQPGDSVLFAPTPSDFTPVGVLALDGVPTTTTPGTAFSVTARRTTTAYGGPPDYAVIVETLPVQGATIALPGGGAVTTGSDGTATITLTAGGPATLRATKPGDVRSASEPVCVTSGSDGRCGTVRPGGTSGSPAAAASDLTPATPKVAGLREGQVFKRGKAPRTLSGSVSDASGVKDVLLRLTRKVPARAGSRARCEAYSAASERWVRSSPCGTEGGRFFSVGAKAEWSYLLPAVLAPGRYVLDIRTVDGAGNVTRGAERGSDPSKPRTRVVFTVA